MDLKLTAQEVLSFVEQVFPQQNGEFSIESLSTGEITVRMHITDTHLRPGGTVSGPSMFALADCCFYFLVLAQIGREALTVTTNCSIDFMRKPAACDMIGKARLLKLGRSLAVGDVTIFSEGSDKPVAHANVTYAIPPVKQA